MGLELTEDELKIASRLKRGDKKKIAEKIGVHVNTVSAVLRGEWRNDNVWTEAMSIVALRNSVILEKEKLAKALR